LILLSPYSLRVSTNLDGYPNKILTPPQPVLSSASAVGFNINTNIPTYLITSGGLFNAFKLVNSIALILPNAYPAYSKMGYASARI